MNAVITAMFGEFAQLQCQGISPRYELLATAVAARPELGRPLLAAPPHLRAPDLYFAAVQYLLRGPAAGHPLGRYLPVLGGSLEPGAGMRDAFTDFVGAYGTALAKVCAHRPAQGNEALRAAVLWPGLCLARQIAGERGLCLIEIGASAGVLLAADRFAIHYLGGPAFPGRQQLCGRQDAPARLVLDCQVRGEAWPDGLDLTPAIGDRVGIDLAPLDPLDPDDADWVRSNVWPEHVLRLARLDDALAEAGAVSPRMIAGSASDHLGPALAAVDDGLVPCVIAVNVLGYMTPAERADVAAAVAAAAAVRDLVVLLNDVPEVSASLFTADAGGYIDPGAAAGVLTMVTFTAGLASVELLARTGPFGSWLEWSPRSCRYSPAC